MPAFRIATRFLRSSRAQTVLIIIGIAVAISVQVFIGGLISSLQKGLIDSTIGRSPQVTLVPSEGNATIEGWEDIVATIEGVSGVKAVAVSASSNAFALKGSEVAPALVRGLDFDRADRIYRILGAIYDGTAPSGADDGLIGKELGERLGVGVGGTFTVTTAFNVSRVLTVAGLFDLGVASLNEGWVLVPLATAQEIFAFGDGVTSIEVTVVDVFKADAVAASIEDAVSDPSVAVTNWKDGNRQLLSGLQAQSLSSNMIQAFILVSVIITIASVLSITVLQKSRQIGILKAMGIKDRAASLIFLYEGLLLGLGGAIGGLLIGAGLLAGFSTFARDSGGGSILTITLEPTFLLASFMIAMLSAAFAGVLPARKSSKLSPIDVIRGA